MGKGYRSLWVFVVLSLLGAAPLALADSASYTPVIPRQLSRARLSLPDSHRVLRYSPIRLDTGTQITLVAPEEWSELLSHIGDYAAAVLGEYTNAFGDIPSFTSSLRLMDEERFFVETGAPRWTNAMYYRGEILIPIALNEVLDYDNICRSVKHELTHAVVNALSGGHAPGWIDEGIAQWSEGAVNPGLFPALRNWLQGNPPVHFGLLQGGFTKLERQMVPAAYAESLVASQLLIRKYGLKKIGVFFRRLREGSSTDAAFGKTFGTRLDSFESNLHAQLVSWAKKPITGELPQDWEPVN